MFKARLFRGSLHNKLFILLVAFLLIILILVLLMNNYNFTMKHSAVRSLSHIDVLKPVERNLNVSNEHTGGDPFSGPQNMEQRAIVEALMHAWSAYKKYAWGHDELRPISKGYQEWFGIGLTIIDSMDTLFIMGLKDEFKLAREYVAQNLTFAKDNDVQLFEIVIRALGGLLSAYHLSNDQVFLDKALDLGNRLMPCFKGPTNVPCNRINLLTGHGSFYEISTAEAGTLQLEFKDLARSSKQDQFEKAMDDINNHIHFMQKSDNLVGCFINAQTGLFRMSSAVSVGASADSYYEYLLKQWIQTDKTQTQLLDDFTASASSIRKHLLRYTEPNHWAFLGAFTSMSSSKFRNEMEHLACFYPGTLALAYISGAGDFLEDAANLTHTCYQMYKATPTGLSPEVVFMNLQPAQKDDIIVNSQSAYNLQRPEAVESMFYMYRATKDPKYRKWGWEIFQAFETHMRIDSGYTSISNVMANHTEHLRRKDKMETFYLAETLKYLYLLFSDDPYLLPIDEWVFNTEAHPLPVFKQR